MKHSLMPCLLVLASILAPGCQTDEYARQLVAPPVGAGKTIETIVTTDGLLKTGRINLSQRIEMPDKAVIDVWVIRARDAKGAVTAGKGTMLILHSVGDAKASFPYLGAGERLAKLGYDVVLPDLRHHGLSTGDFVTYGAKESQDLKRVIDKLVAQGEVSPEIYAFGVNLGAAAAIQYAAIDDRCKGVMAVSPCKDFASLAHLRLGALLINDTDFQKIVESAGRMADFKPADASAMEAIKRVKCPVVIVYGFLDFSVPREDAKDLYDAASEPKKLLDMGLAQIVLGAAMEDWIAGRMDKLATKGVGAVQAATQPSK